MKPISIYLNFLRSKGRFLSEINPGSDNLVLSAKDALKAINLIQNANLRIVGGDILTNDNEKLKYAYHVWGKKYHYLNWSCEELENELLEDYKKRSYEFAENAIIQALKVAEEFKMECLIVLIVVN